MARHREEVDHAPMAETAQQQLQQVAARGMHATNTQEGCAGQLGDIAVQG